MAIYKWLNMLALHLLEIQKPFFISYLFSNWKVSCVLLSDLAGLTSSLKCLTSHLGTDQGLIQIERQSQSYFVLRGDRREKILCSAALFNLFFHRFSKALSFYCLGKRKVYFCAWQRNTSAMGDVCFRSPPENKQPATTRHLAYPVYGFEACLKHPPGRASSESLVLKPTVKSKVPTPQGSTLASSVSRFTHIHGNSAAPGPWLIWGAGARHKGALAGHASSQHLWRGF